MTRLNLIRFWRDGSFIFIALLVGIFLGTGLIQLGSDEPGSIAINLFQASAWPIAVLALNWCYYERENLWIAVVGGRSLVSYFRGLMMAMVAIGLGVAAVILVIILLSSASLSAEEVALVISTPIADAAIATALLTRVRVKPGAFSAGAVAILAGTIMLGAGMSGAMWLIVGAIGDSTALMVSVQLIVAIGLSIGMCFLGLTAVTRLARGFRFA